MSKKAYEKAIKKSVSMPSILFDDAEARLKDYRLTQFSDYIQTLIRQDLEKAARDKSSLQQAA